MRVLIATGIFEPESGGPATYAVGLAKKLSGRGHEVAVLTYSNQNTYDFDVEYPFALTRIKRTNPIANRLKYFFAALRLMKSVDLVYTLDWFAAGLPVAIAAWIARKPYVVRIGGDYLWEQRYLESGAPPMTLADFYSTGAYRRTSYRPFFTLIRYVLRHAAHVIFNSDAQREMYVRHYKLDPSRVSTIYNPVPDAGSGKDRTNVSKEIVFYGRHIVMKNIESLVRAFAKANLPREYTLLLIGDGPTKVRIASLVEELGVADRVEMEDGMRRGDLMKRIEGCRAFILPSWTDISPNQVYEALSIGLPGIVTKENYLNVRDQLPETVDPKSIDDIARKLEMLADDARYADFSRRFRAIQFGNSWDDVATAHEALFKKIV